MAGAYRVDERLDWLRGDEGDQRDERDEGEEEWTPSIPSLRSGQALDALDSLDSRNQVAKISLAEKFGALTERWRPHVVAELNGQEVKVVRIKGEFVWHTHEVDELFWVTRGRLRIDLRAGAVELGPNELFVVPRGMEHRPVAEEEVELVLFEPAGVVNTGDAPASELTAPAGLRL